MNARWGWKRWLLVLLSCFLVGNFLKHVVGVDSWPLRIVTVVVIVIIAMGYVDGLREGRAA